MVVDDQSHPLLHCSYSSWKPNPSLHLGLASTTFSLRYSDCFESATGTPKHLESRLTFDALYPLVCRLKSSIDQLTLSAFVIGSPGFTALN